MTTTHTYIVGGCSGGTSDGTGVLNHMYGSYFAGSGIATEANAQAEVTNAVTMDQLFTTTLGFVGAPTGTLVSRINGSTGNMTISYSSESTSTPAQHTDTTHTDSIAATNLVNCQGHMTAGNIRYCVVGTRLSATSPISWLAAAFDYGTVGNTGKAVSGTTAQYVPPSGPVQSPPTTETNTQNVCHNAGTWQGLFARISANSTAVGSTISSRLNSGAGNQTLSVGSAATGNFYDSTHTDTLADGDQFNYKIAVGDTNSITLYQIRSELVGLYSRHDTYSHGSGSTDEQSGNTAGNFFVVGGGIFANSTEAQHVAQCHTALTTSKLRCQFGGGRASANLFSRVGGSNGNQTITPWVTGFQEDTTHTDSVAADTSFNNEITDSTGAGAVNIFGLGLSMDDGSVSQPTFGLSIVQHSGAIHGNSVPGSSSSVVLGSTPTSGNLLIAVIGVNISEASVTVNTSSWTPFCMTLQQSFGGRSISMMALYRYVQPGDTATLPAFWTAGSTYWTHTVWEITGVQGTWSKDFLFAHTVPNPKANAANFPPVKVPGQCLAFAATASYNGNTNPSYSGAWTTDETHNNNANFGSASGAHRFMTAGQSIDGAPTQGTSSPYGAMFFALSDAASTPTGTPYVRSKSIYANNGTPGTINTYNTPLTGNLWVAYLNFDRGQTTNPTIGAGWTQFVSQNGNGHEMIIGLYRYVQVGDTETTPALVSSGSTFFSVTIMELAGGFTGTFGTDHVSDKSADQATGGALVTTSDTTTNPNQFATLAYANYNASTGTGSVSGTGWADESYLDASDYGAWGVGENTYPSSSSTVQGTVNPILTTDYTAYIQSIWQASGGGGTVVSASVVEAMTLTETDSNAQDDVASVNEAMSLVDSISQTHTQPPPMPIIVVIL